MEAQGVPERPLGARLSWLPGELYHSGLVGWAFTRHGTAYQLKGIVHECAYVLRHNTNPKSLLERGWAQLNPNPRAPLHDVVFGNGGGVQLKDTISSAGARDTVSRLAQYDNAVAGTPETVKAVEKLGAKIDNSGISTSHNEAIAARAGAPSGINLRAVATSAKIGAALGATVGLTIAFVESYGRYRRGEATWDDVALATLKGGCIGGTAGAVSCAVGTIVAMASPVGVIAIGTGILSSVAAGLVADWAATRAWDQVAEWLGDERANQSSEVCWLLPAESASFQLLPYRQA